MAPITPFLNGERFDPETARVRRCTRTSQRALYDGKGAL